MVVGQRLVAACLFFVLDHMLRAEELAIVAQVLMQLLRRVGQDRRQDRLQVVDDPQDDVDRRLRRFGVLLDLEPGRLAIQACTERSEGVAVGLAGQGQRLAQACPEGTEGAARNLQALYRSPTVWKPASTFSRSARSSSSNSPGSGTRPSKRLVAKLSMRLARLPQVATNSFPSLALGTRLLRSTKSSHENSVSRVSGAVAVR